MVFSLNTGRLVLEDMNQQDLAAMQRIACDRSVMKFVLIWLENEDQVAGFVQHAIDEAARPDRHDYVLAIREPATGDFAGFVLFEIDPEEPTTAEAGCILRPEYWKAGYATEILRSLLAFGFGTLSLHRVFAKCDQENHASAHVLEKCGLAYEGTLREHVWLRDHWRSTRYYGMLDQEYRSG
ncbi:GNAT family N-acetyltransferase [Methanoregula sp. UBA64]|jgi:[ribosomal protein S5]-alanine N-acetyltransferase|uniref:GNAT family N-acetyltransferase n=1 Tax=Methanoregula sp. UBA64 TaxID=1915554 RepID=UPI0025D1A08D|nr:GNAT family N-acetyltransferase [Methanoregula sp. UBA64]